MLLLSDQITGSYINGCFRIMLYLSAQISTCNAQQYRNVYLSFGKLWDQDNLANILPTTFWNSFLWIKIATVWFDFTGIFCAVVQLAITKHWTGDTPLHEPMIAGFSDAYICYSVLRRLYFCRSNIWLLSDWCYVSIYIYMCVYFMILMYDIYRTFNRKSIYICLSIYHAIPYIWRPFMDVTNTLWLQQWHITPIYCIASLFYWFKWSINVFQDIKHSLYDSHLFQRAPFRCPTTRA